jgi:sporulation protein YlmC with PRC-barrel domain
LCNCLNPFQVNFYRGCSAKTFRLSKQAGRNEDAVKGTELIGKDVVGRWGRKIGTIRDVIFDFDNWKISAIEVNLTESVSLELGMRKVLRIDINEIDWVGDAIVLKVSRSQLNRISESKES